MSIAARALLFLGALIVALAGLPPVAAARTILFVAPHPDDEALVAAGRIRAAVAAGDTVKVIVVTNGDIHGVERGLVRQGESVAAAELLGLTEQDVIFLGYPDGSLKDIYNAPSPTDIITSAAGRTSTYGNRGLGGMDFHSFRFGSPGPYNRVTMEEDFRTLFATFLPDEIYTVSHFDVHPDHHTTALLVTEALVALKRSGVALSTKLHQGIVWPPSLDNWPEGQEPGACHPTVPFPPPQMDTQLEWKRVLRAVVLANLKCQAISTYATAVTPHLLAFARKDEFFWLSDFGANLAITAEVTASSENTAANQGRLKAVDGLVDGAPRDPAREWVSADQLSGAWLQLDWPSPVSVAQVNLYDRPLGGQNVLAGTLSFSDGSTIAVGALPADGKVLPVTFSPKTVSWVRFTIDQAEGTAAGLSEIQVLGLQSSGNVAPHFLEGPGGDTDTSIRSTETASFSVLAHDLNGDAVQYQWSADGGSLNASGASAVFTPPAVTESTVFTILAQILDGRGGSASSVGFVTVTPGADGLSVSPVAVLAGDSAQGTIRLAAAAPEGGLSVPLSSSNPAAAAVAASVTVPAGAASATFPVTTSAVGATTTVTLSANINGTPRSATLVVNPRPGPVPPGNLLRSSDSIGDAIWTHMGGISTTLNFAAAPDGTQSASRVVTTQALGHALAQHVAVAENTSYTFSFYARNNGGAGAAYSVHCLSNGTDVVSSTPYISGINGSSWTQVSTTFTTPAGCTSIFVYPVRDSGGQVDILLWRATLTPTSAPGPVLSSLTVSPASVNGGGSATGTVTLNAPAPAGGAQVALSSSNPAAVVPASVTVASGATSATFNITTSPVATSTAVTISASYGGETQTAPLTVTPTPIVISALSLSPASVTGGTPSTGTVTLDGPAPAGGAQVALSSNNPAAAVPASVTVSPGATSATFNVTTSAVATSTAVTISASYGGATQTASLTVTPTPVVISALSLSPASVTGGTPATGTVTLDRPAPAGGAQVALSSNNPAAAVPASVTVASGATSATFNITTSPVATSTAVTISASYGGATQTASLTVTPAIVSALSLSPVSVTGGNPSTGTVTLNGPAPAGGAQVALSSSNPAAAVPASVAVSAGATSASFSVTTSAVAASTSVTISASYGGATQSASLTVAPPSVSALSLSQASVTGGSPSTGTVTLNGPAPAGGAQVALSSSNPAAAVPASVTVSAGATSANFSVTTSAVAASTPVTISASFGGVTRTASLTVLPPVVSSLAVSPTSVTGGSPSTGTVTLNGPAPAGGAQVALSSSNPAAAAPSTVTVPAGATSATFSLSTTAVATSTAVTISAAFGGATRTASLTVLPPALTSLSLNPSTVIGGPLGSSTGTVSLNGPAPAGGAQVLLASSNHSAATLPSSVIVPAGATSATFTVTTSLVVTSTTVTISASRMGTTRNANLQVNSALAPVL